MSDRLSKALLFTITATSALNGLWTVQAHIASRMNLVNQEILRLRLFIVDHQGAPDKIARAQHEIQRNEEWKKRGIHARFWNELPWSEDSSLKK